MLGGSELSTTTAADSAHHPLPWPPQGPAAATLVNPSANLQPHSGKSLGLGACCTCATSHNDPETLASRPELPAVRTPSTIRSTRSSSLLCIPVHGLLFDCDDVALEHLVQFFFWGSLARRERTLPRGSCVCRTSREVSCVCVRSAGLTSTIGKTA